MSYSWNLSHWAKNCSDSWIGLISSNESWNAKCFFTLNSWLKMSKCSGSSWNCSSWKATSVICLCWSFGSPSKGNVLVLIKRLICRVFGFKNLKILKFLNISVSY